MSHHTCKVGITNEAETLEYHLEVEYDVQHEEPMVKYLPNGGGDPGCPASLEVTKVKVLACSHFDDEGKMIDKQSPDDDTKALELGELVLGGYEERITELCWRDANERLSPCDAD